VEDATLIFMLFSKATTDLKHVTPLLTKALTLSTDAMLDAMLSSALRQCFS
jgi:hypothetical protein